MAFIMIELFAEGLIEPHHLGFQGDGIEGFADGGVEGVAVEKGLEGGGNGVQILLRADFTGSHCIGEDLLPERNFFLHKPFRPLCPPVDEWTGWTVVDNERSNCE